MEAKKVKIWERTVRKRETGNQEGEQERTRPLPMAGSGKVPITTLQKPPMASNASPMPTPVRRKPGWLYGNMQSRATILSHVSE